ncbi:hypothetical protein R6Q59_023664 [Mikania micrantha]|uniref:Fanconi Anaemia group E protein C-terminal domain-containing protein n=1 Tax=Mikania micrantha TaxID=192012 RepID=A0A5N6N1V3_9ASTR|nr:hypothetical protein E3N88_29062 [Mikania micrantha]
MESWLPLMNIFMNSISPETEASMWFQSSFNSSSNPSISISTASFLSLLMQPIEAVVNDSSSSSSSILCKQRFIWLQTLPNAVQARILSFLAYEHAKFNKQDLTKLARNLLFDATEVDFWVRRAANQLFDVVSDSNFKWVSCLNLDSEEEKFDEKFGSMPGWLIDVASANDSILPWLPISVDDMNKRLPDVTCEDDEDLMVDVEDCKDVNLEMIHTCDDEDLMVDVEDGKNGNFVMIVTQRKLVHLDSDPVDHETKEMALFLKTKILNLESSFKAAELADEIRTIIFKEKKDSLMVLSLIEPWNADDEIVPILLSRIQEGNENDFAITSNILCSIVLPKFLELEKPASRVLVTATINYCKVHYKSAVYALLFPLILHKNGINNPICDVITRIIKDCLHPANVSAICQKLLCEENTNGSEYICPPCYQHLVSKSLVWTESLFNLFQIILNHDVRLTQDSVNQLVFYVQESSIRFSKSLKFANFLLCFAGKCAPMLGIHKLALFEAVEHTSSFLTKSILSKLASIDS